MEPKAKEPMSRRLAFLAIAPNLSLEFDKGGNPAGLELIQEQFKL